MAVADWYKALFEALQTKSLARLAVAAYEILGMPVVVTDVAFIVRAKYPQDTLGDEQWDANVMNRQIEPRFVKTFSDDDHFAHHDEAGKTILTDWGYYERAPRLTSVVRSNGNVIGYFAALASGKDVEAWHYEAADAISSAFAMLMSELLGTRGARGGFMSPLLYAILDESTESEGDPLAVPEGFEEEFTPPYLLFCARTRNPHNVPLEMYLGNELLQYFEHAVQAVHNGSLYILASHISADARGSARARLFAEELTRQKMHCGVGLEFADVQQISLRRWQADQALRVGAKLALPDPILRFDDLMSDVVCDLLDTQLPQAALETATISALKQRDAEHGTQYYDTLRAYCNSGFDRKRTFESLHIHRNTLQYRLDQLRELEGFDITSKANIIFFALEDYRNRVAAVQRDARGLAKRHGEVD